jgi:hypothetical protein
LDKKFPFLRLYVGKQWMSNSQPDGTGELYYAPKNWKLRFFLPFQGRFEEIPDKCLIHLIHSPQKRFTMKHLLAFTIFLSSLLAWQNCLVAEDSRPEAGQAA